MAFNHCSLPWSWKQIPHCTGVSKHTHTNCSALSQHLGAHANEAAVRETRPHDTIIAVIDRLLLLLLLEFKETVGLLTNPKSSIQ